MNRRAFLKSAGSVTALGAAPVRSRAQAREVKVGYILPVTGPLAFEAQLALNGLLLAVDEINGAGGIKSLGGAKITLLPGDTQNKVELGNSEAARLIDQGVTALIGPFSSLVAFSVRQVTEKNKTPFLLLATVADNLRSPDFTAELSKVKAARPDLLLISGYYGDSKIIAETAAKLRIGVHALVGLANAAYSNPKFIAENRELTDQLFDGNYWHNPQSPRARAVFAAYEKRFNATLTSHGVQAYAVIGVLKDALERAGSTDRDKLRDALSKTNLADHILPQDAIKFDDTGENVNATPALLQVQNGKSVVVGPARFAEAKPVFPVPKWHG